MSRSSIRTFEARSGIFAGLLLAVLFTACGGGAPAGDAGGARGADEGGSGLSNLLRWATANEEDNAGFHVYRSTSEAGPFERLNADLVPGAGNSEEQRSYQYEDPSIEPGVEYFYYVEAVRRDGSAVKVTPVIRAPAKSPSTAASEPAGDGRPTAP